MQGKRVERRRHSREFKTEVLQACREPGASVAGIALARGVNANLVHRWLRLAAPASALVSMPAAKAYERPAEDGGGDGEFVALRLPDIRIELRRGGASVTVSWPMAGSIDCAAWLGEWLR